MEDTSGMILSILTTLGTIGSAVAAFYAVKQTIKQRKIETTPQLVIKNVQLETFEIEKKHYNINPISVQQLIDNKLEIINVGSGVALNVTLKIEYDIVKTLQFFSEKMSAIRDKSNFNFNIKSNNANKEIDIEIDNGAIENNPRSKRLCNIHNTGYIPPFKNSKETILFHFPDFYHEVMINKLKFLYLLNGEKAINVDGPILKFSYSDIDSNRHEVCYKSKAIFNKIDIMSNNVKIGYILEFHVVHNSRTRDVLQKLRKSYADFIDEHDFNKNR